MPVMALAGKIEDLEKGCEKDLAQIAASKDASKVSGDRCLGLLQEAEKKEMTNLECLLVAFPLQHYSCCKDAVMKVRP
jgi:hypothetical protein